MSTLMRWGIVGPGRIAPRLVRALSANPRGAVMAVASRDATRAEAFAAAHGILKAYGSYADLLDASDIDAVYIALPNHLHAEWTVRSLEQGKHVLCEKPLALSVAEVDAITAASQRSGRIAAEAFMYLHHPQIIRSIELAAVGALGPLQLISGSFSFTLSHPGDPRADPAMGGGSLWDVGCYPVSFARRVCGAEPDAVAGFARFDEAGVDRTFVGQLRFPGGLLGLFDCGFAEPDRERLEIVGSHAALSLDAPFLPEPDGPHPSVTLWHGGKAEPIDVPSVDQYRMQVDDFMSAILDGTPPRVSLEFSRGNVATLVELAAVARSAAG